MHHLLAQLNQQQQQAVSAPPSHMMVLAGAGSGKTRVLVHRIAWLFEQYGISPHRILAVTFTNKAAHEMRQRIEHLFCASTQGLWIGTFHGIAHRLLRMHYYAAHLPEAFQVIDSADQHRLVRRTLKNLGLDEKHWPPKQAQNFINNQKDNGLRPHHLTTGVDFYQQTLIKIYTHYQTLCDQNGLVDFTELLLRTDELFQQHHDLCQQYQERFAHILIDEFQDTNHIQYRLIKRLINDQNYLTVVGDDDQSIYAWRGARVENIQRFTQEFSQVSTIRLEQNYRSTKNILDASNAVISHNQNRLGKSLWTERHEGDSIRLYAAFNELDEARFIVAQIQGAHTQGIRLRDIAILYRSNAQSRVIEEALLQAGTPYRVYGGLRFFERTEIKHALAYCRLLTTPNDDTAFERIINTPTRGIGEHTVEAIRQIALEHSISLWEAMQHALSHQTLSGRAHNHLQHFQTLIISLQAALTDLPLGEQLAYVIKHSGLLEFYQREPGEKSQARIDNLNELITAGSQFSSSDIQEQTPMMAFLSHAALEAGEGQAAADGDCVQLMTMHSAKGLEFPMVVIAGMEEALFPPRQAMEDSSRLEEERRLCYVAMTRAMQHLLITYAEYRRLYRENHQHCPSRFLREIPTEYLSEIHMRRNISKPVSIQSNSTKRFCTSTTVLSVQGQQFFIGQQVNHPKFGDGIILNFEGQGEQSRLQINFGSYGTKWLVAAYAQLTSS